MKKQIILATFIYFLSLLALISSLYGFFNDEIKLSISSLLIVVVTLGVGYMFNTYLLKQKFQIDENVLHLTHEIIHEITLPISTIKANSLLLRRTLKDDEKGLKRLARIENASERLERLYDELLHSIEKEMYMVKRENVSLKKIIEERVEFFKLLKRNPFLLSLDEHQIFVDRIGLEKALDNVISNAMKYSPKESEIEIVLHNNILTISDKGEGVELKDLKNIFIRYLQLDKSREGKGIGLALVKMFCVSEKIILDIESVKGLGTKVIFNVENILYRET